MSKAYPNTFIVGAPRCATTSLYHLLAGHPDVYMSPVKEPNYFTGRGRYETSKEYMELFSGHNGERIVGEASTSYLHSFTAAVNLKKVIGAPNIIIVVRHPVDRAKSQYRWHVRNGRERRECAVALSEEIEAFRTGSEPFLPYLGPGFYANSIRVYRQLFGLARVYITTFTEITEHTNRCIENICEFLRIDGEALSGRKAEHYNAGNEPRFGWLNRALLRDSRVKDAILSCIPRKVRDVVAQYLRNQLNVSDRQVDSEVPVELERRLRKLFAEDIRALHQKLEIDVSDWLLKRDGV